MRFKNWLENTGYDDHDILVSHNGEELALHPAEVGLSRDFSYSKDDGYETTFRIMPMSSQRSGYAKTGRADFIGVMLFTNVHPGKGTDVAFIKSLSSKLSSFGGVPYKNVGLGMFGGLLRSAAEKMRPAERERFQKQLDDSKDKDFRSGMDVPDFKTGSSNSVKVGKAVSVGSPSWSLFFSIGNKGASQGVETTLGMMKDSLRPFMENGLVHRYRVLTGRGAELESVSSEAGQGEEAETESRVKLSAGYIKFVARAMLSDKAKGMVVGRLDQVLTNLGWKPSEIGESSKKVGMDDLLRFAKEIDSQVVVFFVEAAKDNDKNKYKVIQDLAESLKEGWSSSVAHPADALIYYYNDLVGDGWRAYLDNPIMNMSSVIECLENEEFFERVARNEYNEFKSEYREKLAGVLRKHDGKYLRRDERQDILKLSKLLDLGAS